MKPPFCILLSAVGLERVQNELMSPVISRLPWPVVVMNPLVPLSGLRVFVVPLLVVNRNSHLRRIAVVQAFGAAVVFVAPKILGVIDVRIVVEAVPILNAVGISPLATVRLLSLSGRSAHNNLKNAGAEQRCKNAASHERIPP